MGPTLCVANVCKVHLLGVAIVALSSMLYGCGPVVQGDWDNVMPASCPAGYIWSHKGFWANAYDLQNQYSPKYGKVIEEGTVDACKAKCDALGSGCKGFHVFHVLSERGCWVYSDLGTEVESDGVFSSEPIPTIACRKKDNDAPVAGGTCGNTAAVASILEATSYICPVGFMGVSDVSAHCDSIDTCNANCCASHAATCGNRDGISGQQVTCPDLYSIHENTESSRCSVAPCATSEAHSMDVDKCCSHAATCGNKDGISGQAVTCPESYCPRKDAASTRCSVAPCETSLAFKTDLDTCCSTDCHGDDDDDA